MSPFRDQTDPGRDQTDLVTHPEVLGRLEDYRAAARERALRFDLAPWVERHRELFAGLVRV